MKVNWEEELHWLPGAPNDKPSSAVEVHYPTEVKDATNNDDKRCRQLKKIKRARVQRQKILIRKTMATSITPVTNLPSGFDVIANAAANVDVQVQSR
jgi:hypothetical protein